MLESLRGPAPMEIMPPTKIMTSAFIQSRTAYRGPDRWSSDVIKRLCHWFDSVPCTSMVINGFNLKSIDFERYPWITKDSMDIKGFHEYPYISMEIN